MCLMHWALAGMLASGMYHYEYKPYSGLNLMVDDVSVIRGSAFQVFDKSKAKGHFSSRAQPQSVRKLDDGRLEATFLSNDKQVEAKIQFSDTASGFRADYEFNWKGRSEVILELALSMIWASTVKNGQIYTGGSNAGQLQAPPESKASIDRRLMGQPANRFTFDAPLATMVVETSKEGAILFDARNFPQDWARGKDLLWLGYQNLTLTPNQPVRLSVQWTIAPKSPSSDIEAKKTIVLRSQQNLEANVPPETYLPLIPTPKRRNNYGGQPATAAYGLNIDLPSAYKSIGEEFKRILSWRWQTEWLTGGKPLTVMGEVRDIGLPPEGYRLNITPDAIVLQGQDADGLRWGFQTLAQLAIAYSGGLAFPSLNIEDWPSVRWRGVHSFVGPSAVPFHQRVIERVLLPVRFNKAVLQCERTQWEAIGANVPEYMAKKDLKALFELYRANGIEPIPLIQSFGHMEWLLTKDGNLPLAFNPDVPYSIDPRKEPAREKMLQIWNEAIQLLNPSMVHFGMDEVDRRGFPDDPFMVTRMWEQQLRLLFGMAEQKGLKAMMWGDMALSKYEAPDATNAIDPQQAVLRRLAIPRGAWIGDWHYKDTTDPGEFRSLALWKNEQMMPVAASWLKPQNIRAHTLAAIAQGAGTLQTTWAGYVSNEDGMLREFRNFAGYVLAGEYAWSGRRDMPWELGYVPDEAFARLYYAPPQVTRAHAGTSLMPGPSISEKRVGDVEFKLFEPIPMRYMLTQAGQNQPRSLELPMDVTGTEIAFVLDVQTWQEEGVKIAEIEIDLTNNTKIIEPIFYGQSVRAGSDKRAIVKGTRNGGYCAVRVKVGSQPVRMTKAVLRAFDPASGLRLHGITAF